MAIFFGVTIAATSLFLGELPFPKENLAIVKIMFAPITSTIVIVGYFLATWRFKLHQKPTVMDSYYYLGFLFTIIAMVASFINFHLSNDQKDPTADVVFVISQSGVALSTTIVGMIFRIITRMNQLNARSVPTPIEYEYPSAEEIESYVKMTNSMRSMNASIKSVVKLGKAANTAVSPINSFSEMLTSFGTTSTKLAGSLKILGAESEAAKNSVNKFHDAIIARLDSVSSTLSDEQKVLSAETKSLISRINKIVKEVSESKNELLISNKILIELYAQLNQNINDKLSSLDEEK